jgi:adenylylsulfate kinase
MPTPPVAPVPVLALSGPVGVGKTTVLYEVHDVLSSHAVPHACIERDALSCSWPPRGYFNEDAALENLAAVWANFRAAGAGRLVIAGVVERREDLEGYRRAVPGARITVCRLTAPEATRVARLREREQGAGLAWHLERTVELERILDAVRLEDYTVVNEGRPLREIALEVLHRAGWLEPAASL